MSAATLLSVSMMRLKPRMGLMRKPSGPVRFAVLRQTFDKGIVQPAIHSSLA
jgi:hypothetical protein